MSWSATLTIFYSTFRILCQSSQIALTVTKYNAKYTKPACEINSTGTTRYQTTAYNSIHYYYSWADPVLDRSGVVSCRLRPRDLRTREGCYPIRFKSA